MGLYVVILCDGCSSLGYKETMTNFFQSLPLRRGSGPGVLPLVRGWLVRCGRDRRPPVNLCAESRRKNTVWCAQNKI